MAKLSKFQPKNSWVAPNKWHLENSRLSALISTSTTQSGGPAVHGLLFGFLPAASHPIPRMTWSRSTSESPLAHNGIRSSVHFAQLMFVEFPKHSFPMFFIPKNLPRLLEFPLFRRSSPSPRRMAPGLAPGFAPAFFISGLIGRHSLAPGPGTTRGFWNGSGDFSLVLFRCDLIIYKLFMCVSLSISSDYLGQTWWIHDELPRLFYSIWRFYNHWVNQLDCPERDLYGFMMIYVVSRFL